MKYEVVKEVRNNDGKEEIWYLVEPRNPIQKFIFNLFPWDYSPHQDIKEAGREAHLKSRNKWDNTISRKKVNT